MSIKRRHHYVWQHYLRAWRKCDETVAVLQKKDSNIFRAVTRKVAVQKDFYRFPELTREDELFARQFIENSCSSDELKKLNLGWMDVVFLPSRVRRKLERLNGKVRTHDVEKEVLRQEIENEENYLTRVESDAIPLIDDLRNRRSDIWFDDDVALNLLYFIFVQFFRTKKMRDGFLSSVPSEPQKEFFSRNWILIRHVLATNVGWSLYSERTSWRLKILEAPKTLPFLTSDQPVMNLRKPVDANDANNVALYYPVSPEAAMLLERKDNPSVVGEDDKIDDQVAGYLNRRMHDFGHEKIFASDEWVLEALLHT